MDDKQFTPQSRLQKKESSVNILKIRNILNSIFILGAIVGIGFYLWKDQTLGGYIIIGSMVFKFIECILRIFNR